MSKYIEEFKAKAFTYLSGLSLDDLRRVGREVGVHRPTDVKKPDLIPKIVAIVSGEAAPIERTKRGAPIKNKHVRPEIMEEIHRLQELYLDLDEEQPAPEEEVGESDVEIWHHLFKNRPKDKMITVHSPDFDKIETCNGQRKVYRGQLQTLENVSLLLPLTCEDLPDKILIPVELIRNHDLQEGDVVSCHGEKHTRGIVATRVLTVNECLVSDLRRRRFDENVARYPSERIRFYDGNEYSATVLKYLDWLIPFGKGQRCCVFSAPKAGKTSLLLKSIRAVKTLNNDVVVMALLIDQTPETVTLFEKAMDREKLIYTTDEDDVDRQIFMANFLLKRARSYAESGKNVLLVVDSLSALASIYNETEESAGGKTLACGLETKTIHFIKKFLNQARCLEKGGSLAILASVNIDTGNPADDVLAQEVATRANLSIYLNNNLAIQRIYPAIDFKRSQVQQREELQTQKEIELDFLLRNDFLEKYKDVDFLKLLKKSKTYEEFVSSVKNML
ncbi:MAG: hypothetical protein J6A38_02955 [Clostridia bacterium]|nr:hypothetical protein [Clostridia bacterium]